MDNENEMMPPARPILNANLNMTNCIDDDSVMATMMDTFDQLANILSDHCGPYAKYAVITDIVKNADPIFTKDGINIIRAVEYASPMQEFIKHTLAYIGSRIESAASDGTTSSMLITAAVLKLLIKEFKRRRVSTYELQSIFNKEILEPLIDIYTNPKNQNYGEFIHTKEEYKDLAKEKGLDITLSDIIFNIAYSQAITSSHGDVELSKKIARLFANTPEGAWDYLCIDRAKYESDEKYSIELDTTQWTLEDCTIFPISQMEDKFGTACIRNEEHCIISTLTPSVNDINTELIRNKIVEAVESGEYLTVITPGFLDSSTSMWLTNDLFPRNPNHHVVLILVPPNDLGLPNEVHTMSLMLGRFPEQLMECTLDYEYTGCDMKIYNGLYEKCTTSGSCMHPYLIDQDKYPIYNANVTMIDNAIKNEKSKVATHRTSKVIKSLIKLRNKLTIINRTYFHIGGSAYDCAAAADVVADTLPAVKKVLTKGFALGANRSLYAALKSLDNCVCKRKEKAVCLKHIFLECFLKGIKENMCDKMLKTVPETANKIKVASLKSKYYEEIDYNFDITTLDTTPIEEIVFDDTAKNDYNAVPKRTIVMQPIETDLELMKRFGEVAIKFLSTVRVIIPGGLVVDKTTEE